MQYYAATNLTMSQNIDTKKLAAIAKLQMEYEKQNVKLDKFFESKFTLSYKYGEERGVCQFIFLNLLRNKSLIESILAFFLKKKPKPLLFSLLKCACAEILASPNDKTAKVINSWVECCKKEFSKGESSFANAVLRNFVKKFEEIRNGARSIEDFSLLYSHPLWLAKSWENQFGFEKAVEIMRQNSKTSSVYLRIASTEESKKFFEPYAEFFEPTNFENFYKLKGGAFHKIGELLKSPYAYIQDPATSFAPKMLSPKKDEKILDLCAAPGGKSRIIADLLLPQNCDKQNTTLVSVDLAGERLERLKQNMSKIDFIDTKVVAIDLLKDDICEVLKSNNAPYKFDAIFIDAPCSNTGVLRRRPDARYRITQDDVSNCAKIQEEILTKAIPLLSKNGRLVYSTCSIDKLENEVVPQRVVKKFENLKITHLQTIFPDDELDGAGIAKFEFASE